MKKKHTRAWFINRVGKELIRNNNFDLFTTLIKIQSKQHAIALFLTQVKNNTLLRIYILTTNQKIQL